MKFESGEFNNRETELSHEELQFRNEIQSVLMREYVKSRGISPAEDLEPYLVEWIDKNSEDFAAVFEDIKRDNPSILNSWGHNPEAVLKEIENRLDQLVGK